MLPSAYNVVGKRSVWLRMWMRFNGKNRTEKLLVSNFLEVYFRAFRVRVSVRSK